jgi:hypothetical protein
MTEGATAVGQVQRVKGMPSWLTTSTPEWVAVTDASVECVSPVRSAAPPRTAEQPPLSTPAFLTPRGMKQATLSSPLFQYETPEKPARTEQNGNVLERIASTFTSLLMAAEPEPGPDAAAAAAAATAAAARPSRGVLSPPPPVLEPPRVLPSAPDGCPVAGQPIPRGHVCPWCQVCDHPGPGVFLRISGEALVEDDAKNLKNENQQLRRELRDSKRTVEKALRVQEAQRRQIEAERSYREQDERHYSTMRASFQQQISRRDVEINELLQELEEEARLRRKLESTVAQLKHRESSLERRLTLASR